MSRSPRPCGDLREPVAPRLALAVQYAVPEPRLPRWRFRRWLARALAVMASEGCLPAPGPVAGVQITLRLVDAEEGRQLNLAYRERDYATNVLTFEYGADPESIWHGDIVLCVPVLEREALEQGKPLLAHAAHLSVHGLLHALGFDHIEETQAQQMEALETRILAQLRIPDPYRHG